MFHKVKEVYPLQELKLSVIFTNGTTKTYNTEPLVKEHEAFRELEDETAFNGVKVDVGGYGIVWSDDLDLSCDELWDNGIEENTPFDGLMAFPKQVSFGA